MSSMLDIVYLFVTTQVVMLTVSMGTEQNKALAMKESFVSPMGIVEVNRVILTSSIDI